MAIPSRSPDANSGDSPRKGPRGAGTGGGLLFVAMVLFVGYLALRAVAGLLRLVITALLIAAVIALVSRIWNRRR